MAAYFFFMVRETTLVDMTSHILEIVDVRSDVLVDFLVMLARVVDAVAPGSPLERLSIIVVLVDETTLAGAVIRSWRGLSVNRAHRVERSLILADLIDLVVCHFNHGGDLGNLRCLRELGELIGGHGQVSAWGLVDVMAINTNKLVIEVALELAWPSLRVKLLLGHRKGSLICSAQHIVDVPVDMSNAVLLSFPFLWGAVDANIEDCTPMERRVRK